MIPRDEWITVIVPRTNLYMLFENINAYGNELHYEELCMLCQGLIPNDEWYSFVDQHTGEKYFQFAQEKYATLFRLMKA